MASAIMGRIVTGVTDLRESIFDVSGGTESMQNPQDNRADSASEHDRRGMDRSCFGDTSQPDVSLKVDTVLDAYGILTNDASTRFGFDVY